MVWLQQQQLTESGEATRFARIAASFAFFAAIFASRDSASSSAMMQCHCSGTGAGAHSLECCHPNRSHHPL
jgi:hypothetical protein